MCVCVQTPQGTVNVPGPNPGLQAASVPVAGNLGGTLVGIPAMPGVVGRALRPGANAGPPSDVGPLIGGGGGSTGPADTGPLLGRENDGGAGAGTINVFPADLEALLQN